MTDGTWFTFAPPPFAQSPKKLTPWLDAASTGDEQTVAQLLAASPELIDTVQQWSNYSALDFAAQGGHDRVVAQLLAAKPSLVKFATLRNAVEGGHEKVVTQLLNVRPELIDAKDVGGASLLHRAAAHGRENVVAQLLGMRPQLISACDNQNRTVLHFAAVKGDEGVAKKLIAVNPDLVDAVDGLGCTALHLAAENGHLAIVDHLLAVSPRLIHVVDASGQTALFNAITWCHNAVVTRLITTSPDLLYLADREGKTPLHWAVAQEYAQVIAQLMQAVRPELVAAVDPDGSHAKAALFNAISFGGIQAVEQLLALRPDLINTRDDQGRTPLDQAAIHGDPLVMQKLLLVATPPLVQEAGKVALCTAIKYGREKVATLLLDAKADPNEVDDGGSTTLHFAISFKLSEQFIARLFQLNPDALHAINSGGFTPFHVAVRESCDSAIEILQMSATFDEISSAGSARLRGSKAEYLERWRPILEQQCECLWQLLNQDVVGTVFEYLGFRTLRAAPKAATNEDSPSKKRLLTFSSTHN